MEKLPKPKMITVRLEHLWCEIIYKSLDDLSKILDGFKTKYPEYINLRFDYPTKMYDENGKLFWEEGLALYGDRLETQEEAIERKKQEAQ